MCDALGKKLMDPYAILHEGMIFLLERCFNPSFLVYDPVNHTTITRLGTWMRLMDLTGTCSIYINYNTGMDNDLAEDENKNKKVVTIWKENLVK